MPQPWHLIPDKQLATKSRSYSNPNFKRFRVLSRLLTFCVFYPFFIYRMCWLFFNWRSYTIQNVDQAILCGTIVCTYTIFLGISHFQHRYSAEVIYLVNQIHQLALLCNSVYASTTLKVVQANISRSHFGFEYFVYGISTCHVIITILGIALSFAVPYFPLQLIFGSSNVVKIVDSFLNSIILTFNTYVKYVIGNAYIHNGS